jgi:molybdate/tungstate transport system substrate-binding protein
MVDDERRRTRRDVLRAGGGAALAGLAGCTGTVGIGGSGRAGAGERDGRRTVTILAAGSLQHALENGFGTGLDVPVEVEAHGSATLARMVAEGQRDPDIVTVADTALFEGALSPPWYSEFTSNAVVLAYNPHTEGGRRVAAAGEDRWYEPLVGGDVRLGRTDPDQDPLGYRGLFALELASRYYAEAPDLTEAVVRRDQVYPETALVSQFETGAIDAALAYRNMAVERGYEYVPLPAEVNLSDPAHVEEWYSTVSYTLPSGQKVRGDLVSYGSTIRNLSDAAVAVFDAHTTGTYLEESGFLHREGFPTYVGDVPAEVRAATSQPRVRAGGTVPASASVPTGVAPSLSATVSDVRVLV